MPAGEGRREGGGRGSTSGSWKAAKWSRGGAGRRGHDQSPADRRHQHTHTPRHGHRHYQGHPQGDAHQGQPQGRAAGRQEAEAHRGRGEERTPLSRGRADREEAPEHFKWYNYIYLNASSKVRVYCFFKCRYILSAKDVIIEAPLDI